MSGLFKKTKKSGGEVRFADIDGIPLKEGDIVQSLRYDLGRCRIVKTDTGLAYESLENGEQVSWAKMIDAATKNQKVRKAD
jgi:hypothetical protein